MWRFIVILAGGSGVTILALFVFVIALCITPWQFWAWMAGIFVFFYIASGQLWRNIKTWKEEKKSREKWLRERAEEERKEKLRKMLERQIPNGLTQVVAAVIHDGQGRIYATQRGYGDVKGKWEFPGGKIEPGEKREEALKREIREELGTEITIERYIDSIEWDYPDAHLSIYCYLCRFNGTPTLKEHMDAKWLDKKDWFSVDWLLTDRCVLFKLKL